MERRHAGRRRFLERGPWPCATRPGDEILSRTEATAFPEITSRAAKPMLHIFLAASPGSFLLRHSPDAIYSQSPRFTLDRSLGGGIILARCLTLGIDTYSASRYKKIIAMFKRAYVRRVAIVAIACGAIAGGLVLFVPNQAVLADDPTPSEPIDPVPLSNLIVYQSVTGLPAWSASGSELVVTSEVDFETRIAQLSGNPNFQGTLLVTDDPDFGAPWPPVDAGSVHIRIRFYDVDYYQSVWEPELDNDWVPGFLDEQEAATPTAVEDALYDLDVWQRVDNETAKIVTLRIGAADGAVSYVTQSLVPCDPIPAGEMTMSAGNCNAGPWWKLYGIPHRRCCYSQRTLCRSGAWIVACAFHGNRSACRSRCRAMDCDSCFDECYDCVDSNPCHSCDPCGLSWILCRYFGEC